MNQDLQDGDRGPILEATEVLGPDTGFEHIQSAVQQLQVVWDRLWGGLMVLSLLASTVALLLGLLCNRLVSGAYLDSPGIFLCLTPAVLIALWASQLLPLRQLPAQLLEAQRRPDSADVFTQVLNQPGLLGARVHVVQQGFSIIQTVAPLVGAFSGPWLLALLMAIAGSLVMLVLSIVFGLGRLLF